jgi:hypothetical protein
MDHSSDSARDAQILTSEPIIDKRRREDGEDLKAMSSAHKYLKRGFAR